MKIMYQNFEIVVGEDSFDLYHIRPPKQVHKNKSVSKNVKVCLGYFTKLDICVKKIMRIELSTRKEIVALMKFLELYRSIWEDIISTIEEPVKSQPVNREGT